VTSAERHVTAAYLVVLGVVLLYVVLYAFKLARLERDVAALPRTRATTRKIVPGRSHDGEA
jgi:type II secretory pathway component PulM